MTDREVARGPLPRTVSAAVAAGVDWVQVRERGLDGRDLLRLAREIARAAREGASRRGGDVKVLVNRRLDVARALPADGAHLGFDAVPVPAARAVLGEGALLGLATHTAAEAAAAAALPLDYVHLAPIHPPLSKAAAGRALGTRALEAASRHRLPVLAQGGIDPGNARAAIEAGAAGIAVTGAILGAEDPADAARALRRAIDG